MNQRNELFIALQRVLPKHALSRLVAKLADSERPWLKDLLIKRAIKTFNIDMEEAVSVDLEDYKSFNVFFTRELKSGARPLPRGKKAVVSPADGVISQAGKIEKNRLLQAKGIDYSLNHLVGDSNQGSQYENGTFATIYLSPKDYHRVHIPADGQLLSSRYIPGELFSVNQKTTEGLPDLFTRNERLVCEFKSEQMGNFTVIFVGAMLVAGIETVWSGFEAPGPGAVRETDYSNQNLTFKRGDELGRFKFGSTVILLFQRGAVKLEKAIEPATTVRMGEKIALQK